MSTVERAEFLTALYAARSSVAALKPWADADRLLRTATFLAASASSLTDAIAELESYDKLPFQKEQHES
jgi:hypothetical protein